MKNWIKHRLKNFLIHKFNWNFIFYIILIANLKMNYNRFINGTFDPDPYETTIENSLYPNSSLGPSKMNYIANR